MLPVPKVAGAAADPAPPVPTPLCTFNEVIFSEISHLEHSELQLDKFSRREILFH